MGLRSQMTVREPVPHEPGQWLELRPLGLTALEDAKQSKVRQAVIQIAGIEGLDLASLRGAQPERPDPDVIDQYDHAILLREAITAWSYSDTVNIEDLDAKTAMWAVRVILDQNGLTETEIERKNGSTPSTAR